MELTPIVRKTLGIVGFPFTFMNLAIQRQGKVAPRGRIIQTSTLALHVIEIGEGPVTVILEAGLGSFSIDWYAVQPELKNAKVVAYDRGGYGWSTTHRKTMTIEDTVRNLKELVECLQLEPPFVLVGHSFGGLSMRLFAARYPALVEGLVLLDSVHENQYRKENYNDSYKRLVTFGYRIH